jgi:flagellar biosynthetic protein FliP
MKRIAVIFMLLLGIGIFADTAFAQTNSPSGLSLNINMGEDADGEQDVGTAIQILLLMTLLTLGPSIVVLMTSFTRIIIVLGFVRTALGVHQAPSNQLIVGLALVITFFVMQPVFHEVNSNALQPLFDKSITTAEALEKGSKPLREFMLKQTKIDDVEFFLDLANMGPTASEELPMRVVVPSFVMSEIRTAFQMGFLIFLPFILIDFLVGTTLMAMGMMMMPPIVISLPFKLLLFVLVDGWTLVIKSLVQSFAL